MAYNSADRKIPDWLAQLQAKGFRPYIATSSYLLPFLDTKPFGQETAVYLMDDVNDSSFMEAYFLLETYLLSNSLSFESPNLKMPHWVLVDCVLMQTALVGFTVARDALPEGLLGYYREDERIDFDRLDRVPISGQICNATIGSKYLTGLSLFSLGRRWLDVQGLGLYTKTLALEVYRARDYEMIYGIPQYNNTSLHIHGRFGSEMIIDQPMVHLHPAKDMTFIYRMKPDYDPYHLNKTLPKPEPDFWLNARDTDKKRAMQKGIQSGKRYVIAPPFSVKRDDGIFLPILEKDA